MDVVDILIWSFCIIVFFKIVKFIAVVFNVSASVQDFFTPDERCGICEKVFGDRAIRYKWKIDGKRLKLCSTCSRKLTNKQSSEKFDNFFIDDNSKNSSGRKSIPSSVKKEVWNRDSGKCVQCGSNENLEFDHIIPVSKGGANSFRNIQLLCQTCNRSKSAKIQ